MYVKGWPPQLENGVRGMVTITAYDRLKYLSKITLRSPIAQEMLNAGAAYLWSCGDAVGSPLAAESSGRTPLRVVRYGPGGSGAFGVPGPGVGDGTGVILTPSSSSSGFYLETNLLPVVNGDWSVVMWVQTSTVSRALLSLARAGASGTQLGLDASGHVTHQGITSGAAVTDGTAWHHVALTFAVAGAGTTTLYVDGVSQGSRTWGGTGPQLADVRVGQSTVGEPASAEASALFAGSLGQLAVFTTVLSAATVASMWAATNGYSGDRTGSRIARYLTAAGLTSADWTLDQGVAVVGTYPQAGQTVLQACQDMADGEGGGAVVYAASDGRVRFADRAFRKPGTASLTLHAQQDIVVPPYDPAFDDETLVNSSTVSRSAESGVLSTQVAVNAASIAAYDKTSGDVTSYALTDQDALNLAQARVAADAQPGFRLPQVATDLMSAQNNLYAAFASCEIGSRVRITNLTPGYAPATQADVLVEGLTETVSSDAYLVVFDVSPADNPARAVWNDTSYGRWGCYGQTLHTTLTAGGTTVVVDTVAGAPTFTTVSARYPLKIQIGMEHLQLNSAPGGSASPQTFTGVTRGVDGTPASAQTAGVGITLAPAPAWAL
jgi:hypothetical protein